MPSSYTAFDPTKPAGTQTGPAFATSANANDVATWWQIVASGEAPGYVMAASGGTAEQPAIWTWTNGIYIVRSTNTWGSSGGATGNLQTQLFEVSQDTGGSYATMYTRTTTFDASGNVTSTTGGGGFITFLGYLIGKVKALLTNFNAHTAAAINTVHSAGTMALQNASAVAITGGTASLTTEREASNSLGATITASTAINWALGGFFTGTITGAGGTFTHSNLPNGVVGYVTLLITNAGVATTLLSGVKWTLGTVPSFTASGKDLITLVCIDGATVYGSFLKDVK